MPRPLPLPDELLEEVLYRLPPHEPAELVRAALVCRRWCRLVSGPGFRRRFCEFHRSPPMLGMLCEFHFRKIVSGFIPTFEITSRFISTTSFCPPRTDFPGLRVVDARHGRVLGVRNGVLVVWDPITDEMRELPFPHKSHRVWTAAVLCSSAAGACSHLGPFLIVYACCDHGTNFVYTYSSDAAAWSEPAVFAHQKYRPNYWIGSALAGNAIYFVNLVRASSTALKYDLELHQLSLIRVPSLSTKHLLTTTEDGGLGVINKDDSKLYLWSTKDTHEVDSEWEKIGIELKTLFPVDVNITKLRLIGSGVGNIFMRSGNEVYTIDLKTYEVKKVYEGTPYKVIPYMSFYTPALKGTCTGEGPSAGHSSA